MFYTVYKSLIGELTICEEAGELVSITTSPVLPDGAIKKETPVIEEAVRQLNEYFGGSRKTFELPLCMKGTSFQQKVWCALRDIPYSETRSYKEVAVKVGSPRASRAVGMANHRNPFLIVVPCHRVIGAGGRLTGYAAGLHIKQYLLELEKRFSL